MTPHRDPGLLELLRPTWRERMMSHSVRIRAWWLMMVILLGTSIVSLLLVVRRDGIHRMLGDVARLYLDNCRNSAAMKWDITSADGSKWRMECPPDDGAKDRSSAAMRTETAEPFALMRWDGYQPGLEPNCDVSASTVDENNDARHGVWQDVKYLGGDRTLIGKWMATSWVSASSTFPRYVLVGDELELMVRAGNDHETMWYAQCEQPKAPPKPLTVKCGIPNSPARLTIENCPAGATVEAFWWSEDAGTQAVMKHCP